MSLSKVPPPTFCRWHNSGSRVDSRQKRRGELELSLMPPLVCYYPFPERSTHRLRQLSA